VIAPRPLAAVRYLLPAAAEYRTQWLQYETARRGLGESFADAVQAAEWLARGNPHGFAIVNARKAMRAIVIRRFPYRLLYAVQDETVVVVGIAHTARHPRQFLGRF
jgi:ParE toxin of type II toxin-antitoxin system, parDE